MKLCPLCKTPIYGPGHRKVCKGVRKGTVGVDADASDVGVDYANLAVEAAMYDSTCAPAASDCLSDSGDSGCGGDG